MVARGSTPQRSAAELISINPRPVSAVGSSMLNEGLIGLPSTTSTRRQVSVCSTRSCSG